VLARRLQRQANVLLPDMHRAIDVLVVLLDAPAASAPGESQADGIEDPQLALVEGIVEFGFVPAPFAFCALGAALFFLGQNITEARVGAFQGSRRCRFADSLEFQEAKLFPIFGNQRAGERAC